MGAQKISEEIEKRTEKGNARLPSVGEHTARGERNAQRTQGKARRLLPQKEKGENMPKLVQKDGEEKEVTV